MNLIGCVATYNEAALVADAIDSLWRIGCNRVVVVDGAWGDFDPGNHHTSTDGTQDIALQHGATVIEAPGRRWIDQPEARSTYLIGEPGDWYIVCDADERCQGELPEFTGPVEAYLVELRNEDGSSRVSRMRLFRHSGKRMWYQDRHYCVYADGRLIEPAQQAETFWLEHVSRNAQRTAIKDEWYRQQREIEHAAPVLKRVPTHPLGPLVYIGAGWLPGVPARDLTERETLQHYDKLRRNLDSAAPIYQQLATPTKETKRRPRKAKE